MERRHDRRHFGASPGRALHRALDSHQQVIQVERLGHQAIDFGELCFVQTFSVAGHHHNGHIARRGISAEIAQDVLARALRQHQVEQYDRGPQLHRLAQRAEPVRGDVNVVAVL